VKSFSVLTHTIFWVSIIQGKSSPWFTYLILIIMNLKKRQVEISGSIGIGTIEQQRISNWFVNKFWSRSLSPRVIVHEIKLILLINSFSGTYKYKYKENKILMIKINRIFIFSADSKCPKLCQWHQDLLHPFSMLKILFRIVRNAWTKSLSDDSG
jgi:hypothetical protein